MNFSELLLSFFSSFCILEAYFGLRAVIAELPMLILLNLNIGSMSQRSLCKFRIAAISSFCFFLLS